MGLMRLLPRSHDRSRRPVEAVLDDVAEDAGEAAVRPDEDVRAATARAGDGDGGSEPAKRPLVPAPSLTAADGTSDLRVIAFANQKGGVANTATTLNLGVAFSEMGYRVLVIDLDPQGNLTMSQGMNPDSIERSMFDVLVHRLPIEQVIEHCEIDVAVASIDLAGAELALSSQIGRERALEKALAPILDRYEYILIDTPPSL